VRQIAELYLNKLQRQMKRQGKEVSFTEPALNLLTEKGFNTKYGARFLKRHIDEKVKLPLTALWKSATNFVVDIEDDDIVVKPVSGTNASLN
jgi:ATP-dependent Clp protease ATP-binding subunit ClpA